MFKVLIADDEYTIREGLYATLDWVALQCEVIGLAKDGNEAIALIKRTQPDIVISDIRMPGIDGLQVAEAAWIINPQIKIILLSGYNEFEYAKQALQLGVVDFLLKPTVYEEVRETIRNTVHTIMIERRQHEELAKDKNEFANQIVSLRQNFLKSLLTIPQALSEQDEQNSQERLRLYGLDIKGSVYVLLCRIDHYEAVRSAYSVEEWQLLLLALTFNMNEHLLTLHNSYLVPLKDDIFAIVFIDIHSLGELSLLAICQGLQDLMEKKYLRLTISIGLSQKKSSFLQLNQAYLEADKALEHIFYLGNESIVFYKDLLWSSATEGTPHPYSVYLDYFKPILKSLQIGDEISAQKNLNNLIASIESNRESHEAVKTICIDLLSQFMQLLDSSNVRWPAERREQVYTESLRCETLDDYVRMLQLVVGELSSDIYKLTRSKHKKIVEQVLDIISNHFVEDLNLGWVAEQVHLNSSYVSRLLKNELNENFTNLVTKYRMEKAKAMLKDPQVKIYEVADQIGMPDSHYFSVKFKKYTGMTPSDYRGSYNEIF